MIRDIIAYLESDATLQGLLASNAGNRKCYPMNKTKKHYTTPYILYSYASEGSSDELIESATIQISILIESSKYTIGLDIVARLKELLDIQDGASIIPSTDFYIYYAKHVGGADQEEETTQNFNLSRLFLFRYKRKTGG